MPIFSYFAVVGSVLVALLFAADATLPQRGPLAISTNFQGLPKAWHPDNVTPTSLAAFPAPAPDMSSAAVQAAAPPAPHIASVPQPVVAAASTAAAPEQTATAEPAPKKKKVATRKQPRRDDTRQNYAWSRNDSGSFGGGNSFFGRF